MWCYNMREAKIHEQSSYQISPLKNMNVLYCITIINFKCIGMQFDFMIKYINLYSGRVNTNSETGSIYTVDCSTVKCPFNYL